MASPKKTPPPTDKRVYELRVTLAGEGEARWRQIVVSADCTLAELYWTIQGAFDLHRVHAHDITIGALRYHDGKGSRTSLRRVLDVGTVLTCWGIVDGRDASAEVIGEDVVRNRRHYPKVIGGGDAAGESWAAGGLEVKTTTWSAQDACRGYLRPADRDPSPVMLARVPSGPLTRTQIAQLDLLLRAFTTGISSASALHGFFTAIVSGPPHMPSAWMPVIFGEDHVWNDADEVQRVVPLVMHAYDSVARVLDDDPEAFSLLTERGTDASHPPRAESWCRGYLMGMSVAGDAWTPFLRRKPTDMTLRLIYAIGAAEPDDVLAQALGADPVMYAETIDSLALGVVDIYRLFRANVAPAAPSGTIVRAGPKVGANDPCPCGSGKKYKRCCSPIRAV
jgi:uncharacterized protein